MKLRISTLFLLNLFVFALQAQPYGDEWINYKQAYYKVYIGSEGLYRISYEQMDKAGIPVKDINPQGFQMYWRGEEQYISVKGEEDSSFDPGDYIEFYGTYNDGKLDTELYRKPGDQPHSYMSLYQDSSVYFITWNNNTRGRRLKNQALQDLNGLTADPWYIHEEVMWFTNQWFDGAPFADLGFSSEYTDGEGWMSSSIGGGYRSYTLPTPDFDANGSQARAYVLAYGKSDPTNPGDFDLNGNNHEFEVSVGWGNTLSVLATRKHRGYSRLEFTELAIPSNAIGNTTRFNFRSIFGAKGRHAVSLIKLRYPRKFNLQQLTQKTYTATGNNSFYRWDNYPTSGEHPIVIDLVNKERLNCSLEGSTLKYKRSNVNSGLLIITDSLQVPFISDIRPVKFTDHNFNITEYNYLIITHSSLDSGAQEFKRYRESREGGSYKTLIANTDELYDQYYFGIHHPLAIRALNLKIKNEQAISPDYMLLLGRGQLYSRISTNAINRNLADLVPTYGVPASDYLLAIDPSVSEVRATLAIGRIPAKNNGDISNYLEKLKAWEVNMQQNQAWGKQVLHLAGGINETESAIFQSYLRSIASRVETDSLVGQVRTISKEISSIDKTLTEVIIDAMNSGVSMMTYFGHGSALILEIDIGDVQQYDNFGKTPFFHFNGCVLGNTFEISSLSEGFLFTKNKGALGWLAGSSFGFTNELSNYSRIFYDELLLHQYGNSIGQSVRSTISKYANPNNPYNRAMCTQYLYHGDPALHIYSPSEPDFTFPAKNVVKNNLSSRSSKENVLLDISILNQGGVFRDTLEIQVRRRNISGHEEVTLQKILPEKFENQLKLEFTPDPKFKGINTLTFTIDPQNKIAEFGANGENNNSYSYQFFLPTEGLQIISPLSNQIVTNTQVTLTVQLDDLNSENRNIIFQLDTTPDFKSPFVKTQRSRGDFLISTNFSLLPKDSIDYFWRAAIEDNDPAYESSQFAFIYDSEDGFAQTNKKSFRSGKFESVYLDSISGKYEFGNTLSGTYQFDTYGGLGRSARSIRWGGPRVHMGTFNGIGIWILALNPITEERFTYESPFALRQPTDATTYGYSWLAGNPYYQKGAYSGIYEFNTGQKEFRDSLIAHLKRIPDNFHIYLINGRQTGIEQWEDTLFKTFLDFGIVSMKERVKELYPFGIKGQKGIPPGEALEFYADLSDPVNPPETQAILNATSFPVKKISGRYETEPIGNSLEWKECFVQTSEEFSDKMIVDVIGIDRQMNEFELMKDIPKKAVIGNIDATIYPYIKLRFHLYDSIQRTPPQLLRWIVSFTSTGDASIGKKTSKTGVDTFIMGAKVPFNAEYRNLNHPNFRNVPIEISLTDKNGNTVLSQKDTIIQLDFQDSLFRSYAFSSDGLQGNYNLQFLLNPQNKPVESHLSNNQYARSIFIRENETVSPLEIKVDGRFITYGELVSANPLIEVSWLQTDSFYFIRDLRDISLYLKYPNTDTFILLDPSMEDISLSPASTWGESYLVSLRKRLTTDGDYTLRAEVIAPHNQKLMINEATFSIVSESSISEVFNYPNPFVNDTRFVFTMTGTEPVDLVIDVYNISGRKVKKITLPAEELKIGENITSYRWDGTDEYGDPLANGVYLYKIHAVNSKGDRIKERSVLNEKTQEQFFQDGFGKMYIAR